jgi:hypothetical protein
LRELEGPEPITASGGKSQGSSPEENLLTNRKGGGNTGTIRYGNVRGEVKKVYVKKTI